MWFILTLYHRTAAQIICAQQKKIEKFSKVMDNYKGDIEKVFEYFQNTIQSLFAAGGTDEQVFDRMYEVFTETHITKFNQDIQVWKSIAESSSNPTKQPSTTNILQKAHELYQEYGKNSK